MDRLAYYAVQARKKGVSYGNYIASTTETERREAYEASKKQKDSRRERLIHLTYNMNQEEKTRFSRRFQQRLVEKNLKGPELAAITKIAKKQIRQYKAGTIPRYKNLIMISEALEVTPEWLLTGE